MTILRPTAAFVLFTVLLTMAAADCHALEVYRDGSRFRAEWFANTSGRWSLVNKDGQVCAAGDFSPGSRIVELDKLASPNDVEFVLEYVDEQAGERRLVSGLPRISPLEKPDRSVLIYQIPVRTYLAKGTGLQFSGKLDDLDLDRLQELRDLGADYLWLTGVLEQAALEQTDVDVVKGDAGSYYAIYDNWDVTPQIGGIDAFERVIERAHAVGLRVLIDFVANHTARFHRTDIICKQHLDFGRDDDQSRFFSANNNYYYIPNSSFSPPLQNGVPGVDGIFDQDIFTDGIQLESPARVTGNDILSPTPDIDDWFETAKLNYGFDLQTRQEHYDPRPRTWDQMLDVARYWVEKGVDGFRVDYAHAVPLAFWRYFSEELKRVNPEVFLVAEAYESDQRMRLPGFTYESFLATGFDTVYNSKIYWAMRNQALHPGDFRAARPSDSPLSRDAFLRNSYQMTHYMENHDELRLASRQFAPFLGDSNGRANLGLAYSSYMALLPGHFLLHGGQELQEDASVFGRFAGNNGRTSIFDFVYQGQTRKWLYETPPGWMVDFRNRYEELIGMKKMSPFNLPHSYAVPSFVDLDAANWYKEQSKWVGSYLRFGPSGAYLVVLNSDPFTAHEATIHFTTGDGQDPLGALWAMGVENNETRYVFREIYSREGWLPSDPAHSDLGIPGWALYKSGNIPSGLFLGELPPATAMVFRIEEVETRAR